MILRVTERYNDGRENQTTDYETLPGEDWRGTLRRTRYAHNTEQGRPNVFDSLGSEVEGGPLIVNVYPATHQLALEFLEG